MPARLVIATLLLSLSFAAQAQPRCPSSHFEPVTYYGQAFFDSRPVTDYDFLNKDEDPDFQYIEYQTFEPGYEPVFTISILHNEAGRYRVVLVRAESPATKKARPNAFAQSRDIDQKSAARIINVATSLLHGTRYPDKPCETMWLDGYLVQARAWSDQGEYVGEAYSPDNGTEAARIVAIARTLRTFIEKSADESDVDATIMAAESSITSAKPAQAGEN